MLAKSEQANLQPTLNKRAKGASLTIFVTYCSLAHSLSKTRSR